MEDNIDVIVREILLEKFEMPKTGDKLLNYVKGHIAHDYLNKETQQAIFSDDGTYTRPNANHQKTKN